MLTACFPQDRIPFLTGLALWGAVCGLVATVLRNYAAYAAALAGYTAAIVALVIASLMQARHRHPYRDRKRQAAVNVAEPAEPFGKLPQSCSARHFE